MEFICRCELKANSNAVIETTENKACNKTGNIQLNFVKEGQLDELSIIIMIKTKKMEDSIVELRY